MIVKVFTPTSNGGVLPCPTSLTVWMRLLSCPVEVSFDLQELFSLMRSHLLSFDLSAWAIGVLFRKLSPVPTSFSCVRFSVFSFMLRSLIYLDLSFVQGNKYGFIFILLHEDMQLIQHHSFKMLSFFSLYFFHYVFVSLLKNQVSLGVWVYFRVLDLNLLISMSVSVPIPCSFFKNHYCCVIQLKVRDGDSSWNPFIVQDCFRNPWVFCFFIWSWELVFQAL